MKRSWRVGGKEIGWRLERPEVTGNYRDIYTTGNEFLGFDWLGSNCEFG